MISGKHTGDPQGAEAITPVPLQGQLCSTAVTGLETSWQPPVGPREKMSISWLGGEWLLEARALPKTSMWLLWSIMLCRKQSWDDFHAAPCISMRFVSPCGWQQPLSDWSGNARFFPGVADFVIEDSLTSNASNTLTLENEWCLSCYSHLFLNVKPFIFPPFVFVILFLLK